MPEFNNYDDMVLDRKSDTEKKVEKPKRYNVVLHNDDYSSPILVVFILVEVFKKSFDSALKITSDVHQGEKHVCGTYNKDVAETKQSEALNIAKEHGAPLMFTVEPVEE